MKRSGLFLLLLALALLPRPSSAMPGSQQGKPSNLAERLGYSSDAKLLIVHADDLGVTHSVNAASIRALEIGLVNSASMMVPCPWFPEIAAYARTHPEADLGLHLTLTSERTFYRWGPVNPKDKVPSLVDAYGYFHLNWTETTRINPAEAEAEMRAQVELAKALGVKPTHLDSHQYRLIGNRDLFQAFVRIGREYKLPIFVARNWFPMYPHLESCLSPDDVVIDRTASIGPDIPPEKWDAYYTDVIRGLTPGVTVLIIHIGYDDEEMRAFSRDRDTWGASWRQRDFDLFTSNKFRQLLAENKVKLVTWREIGRLLK
jgi:chitin disaccharide deacetylase